MSKYDMSELDMIIHNLELALERGAYNNEAEGKQLSAKLGLLYEIDDDHTLAHDEAEYQAELDSQIADLCSHEARKAIQPGRMGCVCTNPVCKGAHPNCTLPVDHLNYAICDAETGRWHHPNIQWVKVFSLDDEFIGSMRINKRLIDESVHDFMRVHSYITWEVMYHFGETDAQFGWVALDFNTGEWLSCSEV